MIVLTINGQDYVSLTYEEEQNFARFVMDLMSERWVTGRFQSLLDYIYFVKCTKGSWSHLEDIHKLITFVEYYNQYDGIDLIFPEWKDNGKSIKETELDTKHFPIGSLQREEEARKMVIMAWKEVWETHTRLKSVADGYKIFPGSDKSKTEDLENFQKIEHDFWEEVDKVMKEFDYKCSRHEAYIMVSDYMPRGYVNQEE